LTGRLKGFLRCILVEATSTPLSAGLRDRFLNWFFKSSSFIG